MNIQEKKFLSLILLHLLTDEGRLLLLLLLSLF